MYNMYENEMMSASELVSKKHMKSVVWKHFRFKANDEGMPKDEDITICCHCQKNCRSKRR